MVSTSLAATGTWANGLNLAATVAGRDGATRRNREGWSNPTSNVYTTSDGRYIMLGLQNARRDWPALLELLDHPEWLEDERMDSRTIMKNRFFVKEQLQKDFRRCQRTFCASDSRSPALSTRWSPTQQK